MEDIGWAKKIAERAKPWTEVWEGEGKLEEEGKLEGQRGRCPTYHFIKLLPHVLHWTNPLEHSIVIILLILVFHLLFLLLLIIALLIPLFLLLLLIKLILGSLAPPLPLAPPAHIFAPPWPWPTSMKQHSTNQSLAKRRGIPQNTLTLPTLIRILQNM